MRRFTTELVLASAVLVTACGGDAPVQPRLQAPEPPPIGNRGPGLNDPGLPVVIVDVDACDKDLGARWVYGKRWGTHVAAIEEPVSATGCALHVPFETGRRDGFAGAAFLNDWGPRFQQVYIWTAFQLNPNWQQHAAGVTKLLLYGGGSGNDATEFVVGFRGNGRVGFTNQTGAGMADQWRNQSEVFRPGVWHDLEIVHSAQSEPGAADGSVRIYVDGTEVTDWSPNLTGPRLGAPFEPLWDWHGNEQQPGLKGIQWGAYWGGSGGDMKTHDDWIRYGGLYISGRE